MLEQMTVTTRTDKLCLNKPLQTVHCGQSASQPVCGLEMPSNWMAERGRNDLQATVIGFLLMVIVFGPLCCFSLLFVPIADDFKSSSALVGGVASTTWGLIYLLTPVATLFQSLVSFRVSLTIGILLIAIGMYLSSIVTSLWQLYFTVTLLQGMGASLVQIGVFLLLPLHSTGARLTRNYAIVNTGSSVGILLFSPMYTKLLSCKGSWRLAYQVISGSVLAALPVCLAIQKPINPTLRMTEDGGNDIKVMKKSDGGVRRMLRLPYWIFSLTVCTSSICIGFAAINFVDYLESLDISKTTSARLFTVFGFGEMMGKVLIAIESNRLPISDFLLLVLFYVSASGLSVGITILSHSMEFILIYAIGSGFLRGAIRGRNLGAGVRYFGRENSSFVLNFALLGCGVGESISSVAAGVGYDITGSYYVTHLAVAIIWIIGAFLHIPLIIRQPACLKFPVNSDSKDSNGNNTNLPPIG